MLTLYSSLTGRESPKRAAHTIVDSWQEASQSQAAADAQATLATLCIWCAPHQILSPTPHPAKQVRIILLQVVCYVGNTKCKNQVKCKWMDGNIF
jgi:hypothetical protein